VVLYGQQASRIAALRISEVSCTDAAARLKLGADWATYASRRSSLATPEYDGLPVTP
jgi:hypothetical protein